MKEPRDDLPVIRDHRRQWRDCLYVYPVISRRAKGLSIGVNLNPDKRCNFDCLYCQIDRRIERGLEEVDFARLTDELREALAAAGDELWTEKRFAQTPGELRKLNDIALSGDGEPTALPNFDAAVTAAANVKRECHRENVKIVVITNASLLDAPQFRRALPILDANHGEIWAKLDAGTEESFQKINRPQVEISLRDIVNNIAAVAADRAVVIQSLFFKIGRAAPGESELNAYCERLREIIARGGRIKLIQVHTIARSPQEKSASTIPDGELDAIAERIRAAVGVIPVETYYGSDASPQQQ